MVNLNTGFQKYLKYFACLREFMEGSWELRIVVFSQGDLIKEGTWCTDQVRMWLNLRGSTTPERRELGVKIAGRDWRACPRSLREISRSCHVTLTLTHFIDQNFCLWSYLASRKCGQYRFYSKAEWTRERMDIEGKVAGCIYYTGWRRNRWFWALC